LERDNLWAPWRIKYVQELSRTSECFLCDYVAAPSDDEKNLVLWRTANSIVVLNRFPYNNGHLLIAPLRHIPDLDEASNEELSELMQLMRESRKALLEVLKPHGFNMGINLGRCAGAGLPGHVHIHIVPRWEGDTSFMPVCSGTNVISQSLTELYEQLTQVSAEHGFPRL